MPPFAGPEPLCTNIGGGLVLGGKVILALVVVAVVAACSTPSPTPTLSTSTAHISSSPSVSQPSPPGVIVGYVDEIMTGPSVEGHETMRVVSDKGIDDGINLGTIGYIRAHPAMLMELEVYSVSEKSSELRGWYYETVKPGVMILFNVGHLPFEELWRISDACEAGRCPTQ